MRFCWNSFLIAGLRSVQQGSVRVLGQELYGASKQQLVKLRSQIGFIFQSHHLLESLTAEQNVQMSLHLHEEISMAERTARGAAILTDAIARITILKISLAVNNSALRLPVLW